MSTTAPLGRQFQLPGTGYDEIRPQLPPRPSRAPVEPDPDLVDERANLNQRRSRSTLQQGAEELHRAATEGRPSINAPENAIEGILRDRRFKSQFETGRSRGTYDPGYRSEEEAKLFGYPHDTPPEQRPIYGHMADTHNLGPKAYGHTKFVLKPEVTGRTTMTHTDSLGAGVVPIHHADAAAGNIEPEVHAIPADPRWPRDFEDDYIEAQVHGGVGLNDVSHADIASEPGYGHNPHRVARMLSDAKVPWRAVHQETWTQPRLGADEADPQLRSSIFSHDDDWASGRPTISRRQFTLAASHGFRSAYGTESGKFQEGVGPTGTKMNREFRLRNLRDEADEFDQRVRDETE